MTDYASIPVPEACYVDFCLVPVCKGYHPVLES